MDRKIVLLALASTLFLSCIFISTQFIKPVRGTTTWTVDDDGPANFQSIQEAINYANPEDTIFVYNGTYYENVVVNKSLVLVGENPSITIIDGGGAGIVVHIDASHVEIRNFTVQNGGDPPYSGIRVGGYVRNTIRDCIVRNNVFGIELSGSNDSIVMGNVIMNSSWAGIHVRDSNNNNIHENIIANNSMGVWITSSSSLLNTFYHNNFINNTNAQTSDFGSGTVWDDGYPSGGNYWSDYPGVDVKSGPNQDQPGSDGIGDTAYVVKPYNVDNYPLMNPYISPGEMRLLYYDLLEEYNELLANYTALISSFDSLNATYYELLTNYNSLNSSYNNLQAKYNLLNSNYKSLNATYYELRSKQEATMAELNYIRNLMYIFIITTIIFIATTAYFATRKPKVKPELKTT